MRATNPFDANYNLTAFKEGREEGFNYFFEEYYAALTYHAFRIVKNMPVAEEIASEAFIKLWERHQGFDRIASIRSFLYTTTHNAGLNWLRQQKRTSERLKELAYLSEYAELNKFQSIVETETYREIFIAIRSLPSQCRKIFKKLYVEGKDYKQIAEELGLAVSTVHNQKARGITLIRKKIALSVLFFFQFILFI